MRIALQPVGPVPRTLLVWLADALAGYGLRCDVRPEAPAPAIALDVHRKQYRAEAMLQGASVDDADCLLAVTTEDVFARDMSFVFGLAYLGGRRALVSLHRLQANDERLLHARLLKESLHELGHTWGLAHCESPGCVMRFSNTIRETDAKGRDFCPVCLRSIPAAIGGKTRGPDS